MTWWLTVNLKLDVKAEVDRRFDRVVLHLHLANSIVYGRAGGQPDRTGVQHSP